jgi:hypothetical protein
MAGKQFLSSYKQDFELCVTQHRTRIGKLKFRRIRSPAELAQYSRIIYWGDFQNNPLWGAKDFSHRDHRYGDSDSPEQAYKLWRELYLELGKNIPDSTRIYSVGGCFHGMLSHLDDPYIRDGFDYFLQRADGIFVRDRHSYDIIKSSFSANLTKNTNLGYDTSSLLEVNSLKNAVKSDYFVWSFGRSGLREEEQKKIIAQLEESVGIRGVHINWLKPKMPFNSTRFYDHAFTRMLRTMSAAKFVVTDIYHMTLNSLNVDTPAIVLFREDRGATQHGTLLDDKKKSLYQLLNAESYLVPLNTSNTGDHPLDAITIIAKNIINNEDSYQDLLDAHKRQAELLRQQIAQIISAN